MNKLISKKTVIESSQYAKRNNMEQKFGSYLYCLMKGSLKYIINKNLKNWRNPIFLSWKIIKKCVLHGKTQNFMN